MIRAAGILIIAGSGNALFLRRSATAPDCPGCWGIPGGGQEGDETAEDTAVRECREEIGQVPKGVLREHTRQWMVSPGIGVQTANIVATPQESFPPQSEVDFTTFLLRTTNEFTPELNDEHDGFAWAPIASPPEPLHPGCRIALDRTNMNELDIARAIADGRLTSPQKYENVLLAAIRITGTDVAYRRKLDEFTYRNPDNYLNEEFLARCNGLPVIFLQRNGKDGTYHPKGALLNSEEFSERIVGSIFLPYIAGSEVWGIAKIYDDDASRELIEGRLSTSPAVFFRDLTVNSKMKLEDGATLLIEGKPSLLDHVALCEQGVWDKAGDPTGVRSESREDSAMTTEEEKAAAEKAKKDAEEAEAKKKADAEDDEKKKADADMGSKLDKVLSHLDSMGKRMDAIEDVEKKRCDDDEKKKADAEEEARKKGDPEQLKADKAKKDAEDKDKEEAEKKAKADAEAKAKADSEEIRKRIDEVAGMIPKVYGDDDYNALTDAQARADAVFADFGQHAPRPLQGDTPMLYRRRVAKMLREHSPTWKAVDVSGAAFADDAAFQVAEGQIYAEAKTAARNPAPIPGGALRQIKKASGPHQVFEFVGDPRSWMDPIAGNVRQYVTGGLDRKPN